MPAYNPSWAGVDVPGMRRGKPDTGGQGTGNFASGVMGQDQDGGLLTPVPPVALQKQRNDMDYVNNVAGNLGIGGGAGAGAPPPAPKKSSFADLLALLGGGGVHGSKGTRFGSGDTTFQEELGDTYGSTANLIDGIMRTLFGGKAAADQNAAGFAGQKMGANTQVGLANLGSQNRFGDKSWVGRMAGALNPKYGNVFADPAAQMDPKDIVAGVNEDLINSGGFGGADPTGMLGIGGGQEPQAPPPVDSQTLTRRIMNRGSVPQMAMPRQ